MNNSKHSWIYDILLIAVLLVAAALRVVGLNWDDNQHLHPDERFLTMVESALQPIGAAESVLGPPPNQNDQKWRKDYLDVFPDCEKWGGYFDTSCSPLNPNNRGYSFYVYGDLPIIIVRYVAEALKQTGYDEVFLVGRQLAAVSDILTILILYFIAARLYGKKVGLLAAAFTAFSVMLIQQAHFFTVDAYTNVFMFLAIYFAVRIATETRPLFVNENGSEAALPFETRLINFFKRLGADPYFFNSLGFGLALGMAMASKINAAPLAIILPGAFIIRYLNSAPPPAANPADEAPTPVTRPRTFEDFIISATLYLVLGALFTFIAFRIFQPYAFTGPGFFNVMPSPKWLATLKELSAQTSGDVDFPPALQWARRSHLYSLANLIQWGFGWPLGLLAWAGVVYMAWRMLKGEFKQHALLWGWTMLYFVWQSLQWNSTMRYQLPSYPLLALIAAWVLIESGKWKVERKRPDGSLSTFHFKPLGTALGLIVLILTAAWAVAFAGIYTKPQPRVAATRWIYQNIPGPITVNLQAADGSAFNHPLTYQSGYSFSANTPYMTSFVAPVEGVVNAITLPHVAGRPAGATRNLELIIATQPDAGALASSFFTATAAPGGQITPQRILLDPPVNLLSLQTYYLIIRLVDLEGEVNACSIATLPLLTSSGGAQQVINPPDNCIIRPDQMYVAPFVPLDDSRVDEVNFENLFNTVGVVGNQTLTVTVLNNTGETELGNASISGDFTPASDPRGEGYVLKFDQPFAVKKGEGYQLRLGVSGAGTITLASNAPINESSWDDGLPLRMDGYDGYGGIYEGGLNLELYWDDNADKYNRFVTNLDNGDYIFISSNRQWGTTVRVPERYPLTTVYYRNLLGCPDDKDIMWCYSVAEPGMFDGRLGYELIQTFANHPTLFGVSINDQRADEAFTVYDHPKVLIFKKSADYNPQAVRALLGAVDLTKVIHITPKQAGSYPADLQLPTDRLAAQRAGGTWSELFNYDALINKYPYIGLVVWYIFIFLLGLVTYPILRLALPGLHDRGYPLSRTAGLVIWAWLAWFAASYGIPYTRGVIGLMLGVISLAGVGLAYFQRAELREEWKTNRRMFISVELVFLAFFIIDLLIRLGHPDLWHPWKGGERPMDFAYFNAVMKSTTFPPYDPWFAGGYINYYYYGYVIVGTPVKFLGIVPSIAYNFLLPTLFSLLAVGAFSVAWNFMDRGPKTEDGENNSQPSTVNRQLVAGLAAAIGVVLLGNLGVPRMIVRGIQQLASSGIAVDDGTFIERIGWFFKGLAALVGGAPLQYRVGDWYWYPSRITPPGPGNDITEFPLFTFIYSDLHAHMIAMPIAMVIIAWVISMIRGQARWKNLSAAALSIALGGLFIGVMRPTNTWDFYTYLALGVIATGYSLWRYGKDDWLGSALPADSGKLLLAVLGVGALGALALAFYQPFAQWFGQGYNTIERWMGPYTPTNSYLAHWGLFLFVIVSWMTWETREWLANTPVSALNTLRPHVIWIELGLALLLASIAATFILGIHIGWIALPLAAWALILILRPDQPDLKRGALFLIGTALVLTLVVELVVLKGDIGRQNTIFKFYIQAWLLFAVSAAAAFGWLWNEFEKWTFNWRAIWQFSLITLVAGAAMFTMMGTFDKIRDRWNKDAPHALDSMAFMQYVTYGEKGVELNLSEDYRAIRWMQQNIQGSPVIVEANSFDLYRWYNRFSIYTGLPGVVGWDWHQRQQRALTPGNWVSDRVNAISTFYNTVDESAARAFLDKYAVSYIIVGQLERAAYPGPGLDKFAALDGSLWKEIYRDGHTAIYEVIK